jgi:hypothetical protein
VNTFIVVLCQRGNAPPFENLLVDWVATPPIRVTLNFLGKWHAEWVDGRGALGAEAIERLKARYPLTKYWSAA